MILRLLPRNYYDPVYDKSKQAVRLRTLAAVRRGELDRSPCAVCGAVEVEAHHPDYDAPDAHLRVKWLCATCHGFAHAKSPWARWFARQLELPGTAAGQDASLQIPDQPS